MRLPWCGQFLAEQRAAEHLPIGFQIGHKHRHAVYLLIPERAVCRDSLAGDLTVRELGQNFHGQQHQLTVIQVGADERQQLIHHLQKIPPADGAVAI